MQDYHATPCCMPSVHYSYYADHRDSSTIGYTYSGCRWLLRLRLSLACLAVYTWLCMAVPIEGSRCRMLCIVSSDAIRPSPAFMSGCSSRSVGNISTVYAWANSPPLKFHLLISRHRVIPSHSVALAVWRHLEKQEIAARHLMTPPPYLICQPFAIAVISACPFIRVVMCDAQRVMVHHALVPEPDN